MPAQAYSDEQIDAAIDALTGSAQLAAAQEQIARLAPQLQRVLTEALELGGWFGAAHEEQVLRAAGQADPDERISAVRTLIAEETRVGMLVGVAVGFELARRLPTNPEESE